MYFYGGDHGEKVHDGNFCCDGMVYPDRTPHTGLREYKNVYRPARVMSFDQKTGTMVLHNYMNFVDLKDYLYLAYYLSVDGHLIQAGQQNLKDGIPAGCDGVVDLPISVPEKGKCFLKVVYQLSHANALQEEGEIIGFDEIQITTEDNRNQDVVGTAFRCKSRISSAKGRRGMTAGFMFIAEKQALRIRIGNRPACLNRFTSRERNFWTARWNSISGVHRQTTTS